MKILNHPAVIALGVTTICFLSYIAPLTSPLHLGLYHFDGSATSIYLAAFVNSCILWLLFTGLFWLVRNPGRLRTIVWLAVILFLPWVLLRNFANVLFWSWWTYPVSMTLLVLSVTAFVGLLVFSRPSVQATLDRVFNFASTLLAFVAISGGIILIQLLWFAWQARSLNAARPLHYQQATSNRAQPTPRVIWIVLDELSYQQVYEQRYPGLELPAFDQLASQSTVFTHVVPAGIRTQAVLPALMTGIDVDRIRSTSDGRLLMHNAVTNGWQHFDQHDTVFQDALNGGYSTAIAGWYNPYCRIMPQVLDRCFWTHHMRNGVLDSTFSNSSFVSNLLDPWQNFVARVRDHLFRTDSTNALLVDDAQQHTTDYRDLVTAGDALLRDSSVTFMLLHLPLPHPGAIYSRRQSAFVTSGGSYIDNLALADHYLAHVRELLQQQGTWDSSAIIIMGDHSWRTKLIWDGSLNWSAEDQAASHGGQFDDRPGYIVKMPEQQHGLRIDTPFPAMRTHALLDAIITHKIRTAGDLATWVASN